MSELDIISSTFGEVLVSEELIELLGGEAIDAVIRQLRLGGGRCWICRTTIHPVDDVSLVAHLTAAGRRAGFVHLRCAPPQVIDRRRNRRAALSLERHMKERMTDAQAFAGCRDYPAPHAFLVVSSEVCLAVRTESGDLLNPWLDLLLENGLELMMGPDLLGATPARADGCSLRVEGDLVTCDAPNGAIYTGPLEMPLSWLDALISERLCVVLAVGMNVDSDVVGSGCEAALNMLSARGLVAGGTVKVSGSIGLYTAHGAALAGAELLKTATPRNLDCPWR